MHDNKVLGHRSDNGRQYYRWHRCEGCGAELVTQNEWVAADRETRAFWRDEGKMRQFAGPYCHKKACQAARREKGSR